MAKGLSSKYGRVDLLKNNPRVIRDNQFNSLVDSMDRDPEFMDMREIVVWRVPQDLGIYGEDAKCPFKGQEGQLVIIGGNQRAKALMMQGEKNIPDEWVKEAKDREGNWFPIEKAMRFVLVDNSQEGNSGYNDYEKLAEFFDEALVRMSGVDMSEFVTSDDPKMQAMFDGATSGGDGEEGEGGMSPEDELEAGEHGEKSPELEAFIAEREKTRRDLKEINDTGFHLCMIFDTIENKAEFVSGAGLTGSGGKIAGNGTTYVDLVFESYRQKMDFAEKAGLLAEDDEGDPRLLYGMFCDGRYIAEKMGISLSDSGLHFRERILDTRLAAMARDEAPQKTAEEIAEEQFRKAKEERAALGMPTGRVGKKKGRKGKKGDDLGSGIAIAAEDGEVEYGDDMPPEDEITA